MMNTKYTGLEIAVIGMAGKFPGAEDVEVFWENIRNGKEAIQEIPEEELTRNGVTKDALDNPLFIRKSSTLEGKDLFDSNFFGITPAEAEVMDPQLRQLYQSTWHAIEDSGNHARMKEVPTAIFMGASHNFEWEAYSRYFRENQEVDSFRSSFLVQTKFISTSLAYHFGLKGPALYVDTACSTSLMAVHLACRSLITGEAKMALAGGVSIRTNKRRGQFYNENGIVSKDGRCMSFHKGNSGTIGGEGVGVVVLKKLQDAIADGDVIHAIIKGSASNNDGKRKVGYTAPSVDGQSECIRLAQKIARVKPETIGYIEGHGSATQLGDPVEVSALKAVFGEIPDFSAQLGSIKSNIGHLDAAAGIAGLIKGILILKNKTIPKAVHSEFPIDDLTWNNGTFLLNKEPMHWEENDAFPRRAGVSSFAIGGTNVHVILEEAPLIHPSGGGREQKILTFSAKSKNALLNYSNALGKIVSGLSEDELRDFAYSSNILKKEFNYRCAFTFTNKEELISKLAKAKETKTTDRSKNVVFVFSGLGGQYAKMCAKLYAQEPHFAHNFDTVSAEVKAVTGLDLPNLENFEGTALENAELTQLELFCIEYALAKTLINWGVRPSAMIGYSFGEYVAATVAGVWDITSVAKILQKRGELIESLPEGRMLGVGLPTKEVQQLINGNISIAIDNGQSCVVAGSVDSIEQFHLLMKERRIMCTPLFMNRAMHTPLMMPIAQELEELIASIPSKDPEIMYISNVTGTWITNEEATSPQYWSSHLSQVVQFTNGVKKLLEDPKNVFIEIGNGSEISAIIGREIEALGRNEIPISLIRPEMNPVADEKFFAHRIAKLWCQGVNIDWDAYYSGENRVKKSLPGYQFERISYPCQIDLMNEFSKLNIGSNLHKSEVLDDWIYYKTWEQSFLDETALASNETTLIFCDEATKELWQGLEQKSEVILVEPGNLFEKTGAYTFTINPQSTEDYSTLFQTIEKESKVTSIVYAWPILNTNQKLLIEEENALFNQVFLSLSRITKGLLKTAWLEDIKISVITQMLQDVTGAEKLNYEASLIMGVCKALPRELGIPVRSIDIDSTDCIKLLYNELLSPVTTAEVSYRNNRRWTSNYETKRRSRENNSNVKQDGTYLILGGHGKVGRILASHLVETYNATIIVAGRRPLDDELRNTLKKIDPTENRLTYETVDICSKKELTAFINTLVAKYGKLDGVINAAGNVDHNCYELVENVSFEKAKQILKPKVEGINALYEATRELDLDFVWTISSLASLLGGVSYCSYSAANSYVDYFIQAHKSELNHWRAVQLGPIDYQSIFGQKTEFDHSIYLTAGEFNTLFEQTIGQLENPVFAMCKEHLPTRIDELVKVSAKTTQDEIRTIQVMERPDLSTEYVAPESASEIKLVGLVESLFGIKGLGIEDNFYEIGGDSLKAIVLIRKIKEEFEITLTVNEVLSSGTFRKLSTVLDDIVMVTQKVERETKIVI